MARKRMISHNIWGDPSFNRLSHSARLLVVGMISNADDEGRERGDDGSLRRNTFGFDEYLPDGMYMNSLVAEIKENMGRTIHFYQVNDEMYYHFINWGKYQKQQKDRIQESQYPRECSKCLADDKQMLTESRLSKVSISLVPSGTPKGDYNPHETTGDSPLESLLALWGSRKVCTEQARNTTTKKQYLKPCRGITPEIKKVWQKHKGRDYDEIVVGLENYCKEIKNRDPSNDYAFHRFSFYEFLKQQNGLLKFINR